MPEPGTDSAPGRGYGSRWTFTALAVLMGCATQVAGIALQLAGAGAGVAAALAVGSAGPARAAGGAVAGVAGPQDAAVRWLVLAGAVALVLVVPVAAWWLIGDLYSSLTPNPGWVFRPFPAAGRAAGRGSVLAAIVAATWLTWASLRHQFDLRWWSVLGPLLPAGILAGFIWRVLTARVDEPDKKVFAAGCLILTVCPVVAALLGWAVTRSLTLL